jgi:hypothetical protein
MILSDRTMKVNGKQVNSKTGTVKGSNAGKMYFRGCPYCDWRGSRGSSFSHVKNAHPDKPQAGDFDFPGWRD